MTVIWMALNTFYELFLANMVLVFSILIPWLALILFTQFKKAAPWSKVIKPTLVVTAVLWFVFFALVPSLTKSSFADVNSGIDWLTVIGLAAAFAGLVAIFIGPLCLLRKPAK